MIPHFTRSFVCFPALAVVSSALSFQQRDGVKVGPDVPSSEFDLFCDFEQAACPCDKRMTYKDQGKEMSPDMRHGDILRQQMIYDARALEAFENVSKAEFFKRHGFVILNFSGAFGTSISSVTEVLFPYSNITIKQDNNGMIRGPNPGEAAYGWGNHQDCSLNASGFQHSGQKQYPKIKCGAACGFDGEDTLPGVDFVYWLNLWGPIGMKEPLMHAPLAVEDPNTADLSEIDERDAVYGIDERGYLLSDWQVTSRCQGKNKWYYYPKMLNSEFMVFTHFVHHRGDKFFKPYMRSNLHGAVHLPFMDNWEKRRSGERRVMLFGTNYDRSTDGQRVL